MEKKLSLIILGLTPIFFLPTTQNFYDTNKWMLIAVGALFILIVWAIKLFRVKQPLSAALSWGSIGFGALTIASVIGLFAVSTNKTEAILSPLGPITFAALTILILAASCATIQEKMHLRWFLYAGTAFLGLIALYQALGMGKLMFPQVPYLADPLWTPTGSVATTIALFFITLTLLIPDTIASLAKRQEHDTIALLAIALIVIGIGTGLTLFQFIPKTSGMLPFGAGWKAAFQIFKNPTTAIAGFGAENFVTAFTMSRPASLNITGLATITFATNADFFLHILTVYGLIGLSAGILVVVSLFGGNNKGWLFLTTWISLAGLLLIPPTIPLLTVIAAVLIISRDNDKQTPKPVAVVPWIRVSVGILLLLAVAAAFTFLIRAYTAEVFFFRSLLAAQTNDGTKTYTLQIRAIQTNMFVSRYHIAYSQTNFALANSISTSSTTDQDRQLVQKLIQQAIREAKIAVTLNTRSVAAWENLGLSYQTVIPVASEAAGWALSSYEKAATLDPSNPALFLNIGSIFVRQKEYDKAIAAFQQAIQLNPSYANAYYNLANAYKIKGDTVKAAATLTKTMTLVEPGSTDYFKVKNELDALQQNTMTVQPSSATESSVLTLP